MNNKIELCCPYCTGDVSQLQCGEDDSIDYCKECDLVVEGESITKLMKGNANVEFK